MKILLACISFTLTRVLIIQANLVNIYYDQKSGNWNCLFYSVIHVFPNFSKFCDLVIWYICYCEMNFIKFCEYSFSSDVRYHLYISVSFFVRFFVISVCISPYLSLSLSLAISLSKKYCNWKKKKMLKWRLLIIITDNVIIWLMLSVFQSPSPSSQTSNKNLFIVMKSNNKFGYFNQLLNCNHQNVCISKH